MERKVNRKKQWGALIAGSILLASLGVFSLAAQAEERKGPATRKRAERIEFDERLIMGQSLKSGAVYLFERKDSEIQSMLKVRKDFRKELLEPIEPEE